VTLSSILKQRFGASVVVFNLDCSLSEVDGWHLVMLGQLIRLSSVSQSVSSSDFVIHNCKFGYCSDYRSIVRHKLSLVLFLVGWEIGGRG